MAANLGALNPAWVNGLLLPRRLTPEMTLIDYIMLSSHKSRLEHAIML